MAFIVRLSESNTDGPWAGNECDEPYFEPVDRIEDARIYKSALYAAFIRDWYRANGAPGAGIMAAPVEAYHIQGRVK